MPSTTPKGWPYHEPDDFVIDWPATSKQLATKLDAATSGGASRTGFVDAGAWGAMPAGSGYAVNIPHGLAVVRYVFVTWHYLSRREVGYNPPGTTNMDARHSVVVSVNGFNSGMPLPTLQIFAFFRVAYTPDARGSEGIMWHAIGDLPD